MIVTIRLILFLLAGCSLGWSMARYLDPLLKLSLLERFVAVLTLGFIGLGFLILVLALLIKSLPLASAIGIAIAYGVGTYPLWILWQGWERNKISRPAFSWTGAALAVIFLIFLGVVLQTIVLDAHGLPMATIIGWGDVAYHLDMIGHLAHSQPFTLDQPIANGAALTYPFMVNFLSAILLRLGLPLLWAWYVPTIIFSISLFFAIYALGQRFFSSKGWAVALVVLTLFGGGLGFAYFFNDLSASYHANGLVGVEAVLNAPPHQYTHLDMRTGGKPSAQDSPLNIVWITPAISFFAHQRSFALGSSLLFVVLLGWLAYDYEADKNQWQYFARWLPLLALLPLVHTHTTVAAAIIFGALLLRKLWRRESIKWWLVGGVAALAVVLPQLVYLFLPRLTGAETGSMFKLWWGWMTCTHSTSWLVCNPGVPGTDTSAWWFWIKNFGVIFLSWTAAVLFLARFKAVGIIRVLIPASLLLFLIPNIMLFQPWEFDNNKILFYWWFLAVVILLGALKKILWRPARVILLAVVLVFGSLAGLVDASTRVRESIDAIRLQPVPDHAGFYGSSEQTAATWIENNTATNDAFLASDGASNFIPMLTGRPLYLGFSGWLWTQGHGGVADQRKAIAQQFFATGNPSILCLAGVRWLMWEPSLFDTYPQAKYFQTVQLGFPSFSQQTPYGQREIFKLNCLQ